MASAKSTFVPALLVIDMQYDFVHGSLAVPNATTIIDIVNSLLALPFATKIGTKDFHPPNHVSFAATHDKDVFSKITIYPPGDIKEERALEQVLWPVHCVASTPGSAFVEGLDHKALDSVIYKGTHPEIESYSAFQDPWHLATTELPKTLEGLGVTDVFLVGLAGDYCVKCTAMDAADFGYKTWVIKDAVRSVSEGGSEWEEMEKKGIHIVDSAQVRKLVT
ncbi:Nicotinamidase [Hypsizygus marmoreus]|uniref:nicotinamidase n=1 Tax=Hypsizygus marmoreus TaxID=39966 RepID=A0A369K6I0_HYPMA|nr:Nicotinamidase [Hypsizygus marmoreus]